MSHVNHENEHLVTLLRRLCEAELSDDAMICHDGGFRYTGDFMSMEQNMIEPAEMLSDIDYETLLERGYVEEAEPDRGRAGGFRVTAEGRRVAYA